MLTSSASRTFVFVIWAAIAASGCSRSRSLRAQSYELAAGSNVRVSLRDGRVVFVRRAVVRSDTLFGDGIGEHRVDYYALPMADITEIMPLRSDEPISGRKTALLVAGMLIVGILFFIYVYIPLAFRE